jgi:carboxyl-terminal processing protease
MTARSRLLVAFISTGIMGYVVVGSLLGRVFGDTSYGQLALFNEVIRLVLDAYVEPVNLDHAMAGADQGILEALDGDSAYLDADDFKAYQQQAKDSDADVGLTLTRRFSFLMVVSARPGSPGAKAGLKPGDVIKTIDSRHSRQISVPVGERLLRGAPGSVVKVRVIRPGNEPVEFSLVRERLAATPPRGKMLEDGVAYLKVPELAPKSADEARSQVESLKRAGARKLVLDLRGAGYGIPAESVRLAEMFLKGGVVTRLAGRKVTEQVLSADASRSLWDLPMAVLIDTGTAGSGEIVAAALLDAGRGPIVGEHSFGRAPVQKAVPLGEGGLVLTVAKYLSPKGNAIHGKGIEPTVNVETPLESASAEGAPAADPVLDKALELLKAEVKKAA